MKRFVCKVIVFMVFCAGFMIIPSVWIDPYNVLHWEEIRNNGVEPNKNYIKMKYILNNPDKYDSYLFGSSRVGSIHVEKIMNERCYNMTYSCGTPKEHLENLKTLIEHEIYPEKIYMGVDSLSYTENPNDHLNHGLQSPYEYLKNKENFLKLYLNPSFVLKALPTIMRRQEIEGFENFYEYGWWCDYNRKTTIDWDSNPGPSMGRDYLLEETLENIKDIVVICEKYQIELILFTNPMHHITQAASIEQDYLVFLERLAHIKSYYNFSGYNMITLDNQYYIDTSHYNAYVGDLMIDVMCNNIVEEELYVDGFGMLVNKDNVNLLLELLKSKQ